jgi:hypothetical protein
LTTCCQNAIVLSMDLYSLPHKALRDALGAAGTSLGAGEIDPAREALDLLADHAAHEEAFIHPLLARHLSAVEAETAAQHRALDALLAQCAEALDGDPVLAYRSYQRLLAFNLSHLDHEETVVMPALARAVPAEALIEVFGAFQAAHPDANALYIRWPAALTPAERARVGA